MGLDLRTTGRAKKAFSAEVERELGLDDVASLLDERAVAAPQLVQLRERHHALARHIAEGRKPGEAAILCRYSQSRMSVLLADPAFQELVQHYTQVVNHEFVDFQAKLAELALDAASILQSRMEDDPDKMSDALVLQIVQVGADRTGHGPTQKTEMSVKVGLADRFNAARQRVAAAQQMKDITPEEAPE